MGSGASFFLDRLGAAVPLRFLVLEVRLWPFGAAVPLHFAVWSGGLWGLVFGAQQLCQGLVLPDSEVAC